MKIFLAKVRYEILRAAECLESKVSKNAEVFRVQIESLQDSVSLFHIATATKKSRCDEFSKVLADAQSTLRNLISRLDRAENEEKSAARSSPPNSSGVKSTVQRNLVEIPTFCGDDPLKFRSFMALFMDRFHSNSSLTNIEKFILLTNYLEGEAYDVINEIPITEENFSICLDVLEEMYGHENKYIDALFNRLVRLPIVAPGETAAIRITYWKLEAILRSLDQHGEPINEIGFLQSLYSEKFANVSGLKIEKFPAVELAELRELVRNFLTKEQSFLSAFASFKKSSSDDDPDESEESETEPDDDPDIVEDEPEAYETETTVSSNEIVECIFCSAEHCSEECTVYPSAFQRKKKLQHLCYKCLEAKHVRKPCVNFEKCVYCDEDSHNRVFCPQKCRNVGLGRATERLSDEFLASSSSEYPKPTSSEPSTNDDHLHPTTPLTTCTVIETRNCEKKTSVRLVIASGSVSKISESAIVRLGVTSSQIEEISRSNGTECRPHILVAQVSVHVSNGPPIPLRLLVVKEVCDKTVITPTVAEFKKEHPHLAGMHFPDSGSGLPIEMVIGGDTELGSVAFNRGLYDEECPRVKRGWSLVSTRFGWIILGKDKSNEPISFSMAMESS